MLALLLPAACADCSQDPAQAGFFCGVRNLATGTYEHRQTELSRQASQTELAAGMRQQQASQVQSEAARLSAEQSRLKASLASIQQDVAHERSLIAQAAEQRDTNRETLVAAEGKLRALQAQQALLSNAPTVTQKQVEDLRRQNQELQETMRDIRRIRAER